MEPIVSEPKDHPTYKEIADCLFNMAQSLLSFRQDILRMEGAAGDSEINGIENNSRSEIIEESVREIPKEELDSIFEANNQTEVDSPQSPEKPAISPVSEPETQLNQPVAMPSTEENTANLHQLLVLVSSGGMQPNPPSPSITTKTFGEICELTKKIKEEPLSPLSSRMDAPLFIKTEPLELSGDDSSTDWSSGRKYECDQCSKKFANKFLLKKHQFIHTGVQPFKCDLCHRSFNRKDNMVRHRKTPHSVSDNSDREPLPTAMLAPVPVEINEYLAAAMSPRFIMPRRSSSTSTATE